jgi:hypothetical protein
MPIRLNLQIYHISHTKSPLRFVLVYLVLDSCLSFKQIVFDYLLSYLSVSQLFLG